MESSHTSHNFARTSHTHITQCLRASSATSPTSQKKGTPLFFFARFYSLLFAKELRKRSYTRTIIRPLHEYSKPFLVYIAQVNSINCLADMEQKHILEYCSLICKGITSSSSSFEIMHVNRKLTAVRMLCIYMHLCGVVSVNHAKAVPFIPLPDITTQTPIN